MKSWKSIVLLITVMVLTGCVSLKTPPATPDVKFHALSWQQRQKRISRVRHFVANGAFSIQRANRSPELANYRWTQNSRRSYRIHVFSPLNLFNITVLGRPGSVSLLKSGRQQISAPTPERLLKREMGWNMPIRNLYYWIRGVVAPGSRRLTTDQYGHVMTLRQNGWRIQFSRYIAVQGYDLPQRLVLIRPGLRVTLVIKRWSLT